MISAADTAWMLAATALVLQALAARRDLHAELESPLLPS